LPTEGFTVRHFPGFAELPAGYSRIVGELASGGFFCDPAWFKHLMNHHFSLEA